MIRYRKTVTRLVWPAAVLAGVAMLPAAGVAQNEQSLKSFFEGKSVSPKIDMPASQQGVDVRPERSPAVNYEEYGKRIKKYGVALYSGEPIMITKVRVKGKHIEFQLGGGGYGTFGDESGNVHTPNVPKTKREKELDKLIKKESNSSRKKELEEERDELRTERRDEERRLRMMARVAEEEKKARIRDRARDAGSRFNIRYENKLRRTQLTPGAVMASLAEFVSFPRRSFGPDAPEDEVASVVPDAPAAQQTSAGGLRKGLLWAEVMRDYGAPASVSERMEGTLKVLKCAFDDNDRVIEMEFVEGVLIRYAVRSK